MKPIKFRVWDKFDNVMMVPDSIEFDSGTLYWIDASAGLMSQDGDSGQFDVMQFTGIKDVNGTEIYESDIVKYHLTREYGANYDPISLGFIDFDWSVDADIFGKVVIWPSNGVMMTRIVTDDPDMFDKDHPVPNRWHVNGECEVVGNIYENPELLEASK